GPHGGSSRWTAARRGTIEPPQTSRRASAPDPPGTGCSGPASDSVSLARRHRVTRGCPPTRRGAAPAGRTASSPASNEASPPGAPVLTGTGPVGEGRAVLAPPPERGNHLQREMSD